MSRAVILGVLFLVACTMPGCLGIVWLGTVGVDLTRTSDIEFHGFEDSWIASSQDESMPVSIQSIALVPFAGDPAMAERWAVVLHQLTNLRVLSSAVVTRHGNLPEGFDAANGTADEEYRVLAQRISNETDVDSVLFGRVVAQPPQPRLGGLKQSSSRNLFLSLVRKDGALLWKTRLPFTLVTGAKDLNEVKVTEALVKHVEAEANTVGLVELGVMHERLASGSRTQPVEEIAVPGLPVVERP